MAEESSKTFVFGGDGNGNLANTLAPFLQQRGIDPNLLLAMGGGNGFGFGNNNIIELLVVLAVLGAFTGNGFGGGGFGGGNRGAEVASLLNNDAGREMLSNAVQGNANAISQLASTLNCSVTSLQTLINGVQNSVAQVGNQVGLSGQQVINAVNQGNMSLAQQLCKCCCDNQLAIANQTSALQQGIFTGQTALNQAITQNGFANQMGFAGVQKSVDMASAQDRLDICQQTNDLKSSQVAGNQLIRDDIAALRVQMTKEFCDVKERELQNKIDALRAENTQLKNDSSNFRQTQQFETRFDALQNQIQAIACKIPNTVPVTWPNIVGVQQNPYGCNQGCGCSGNNFFGA